MTFLYVVYQYPVTFIYRGEIDCFLFKCFVVLVSFGGSLVAFVLFSCCSVRVCVF